MKSHNDDIHDGLVFNCEYCEYTNGRKENLKRHCLAKHSATNLKRKRATNPSSCKEEGCTFVSISRHLKRHVETTHEGIITRLKCEVLNCNFETTWTKSLREHAKVHVAKATLDEKNRTRIECVEEGCNVKVQNIKRHMNEVHFASADAHTGTRYICKWKHCFETKLKRYLAKHMKRCKLQDSESLVTTSSVFVDIKM